MSVGVIVVKGQQDQGSTSASESCNDSVELCLSKERKNIFMLL
jgi:hypothetical protein